MDVYIALVHHPVRNRLGAVVSTAVTNMDIHDLARTAVTYGCRGYVLVTPIVAQREMVRRIVQHWTDGDGRTRNPIRSRAFSCVSVADSLADAIDAIAAEHDGTRPWTIATGAGFSGDVSWQDGRRRLAEEAGSALLVFGTGWGLDEALVDQECDSKLPGIHAVAERAGYNHLPVRAAVAITLDRLLGASSP